MSIAVKVPTILRTYTGGEATVSVTGDTLADALADLDVQFPGIGARVLDDQGKLRRFVNVYVNDDDVRFLQDLQTPTPVGSRSGLPVNSRKKRFWVWSLRSKSTTVALPRLAGVTSPPSCPSRKPGEQTGW